jgi:hypothetical protein
MTDAAQLLASAFYSERGSSKCLLTILLTLADRCVAKLLVLNKNSLSLSLIREPADTSFVVGQP